MDCVTNDILEKGVDDAMTANRGERVAEDDLLRRPQIRWDKDRKKMMMMGSDSNKRLRLLLSLG